MDLVRILRAYVVAAIASVAGYKALVLDKETMKILSTMFGRSELAESNIVHIERLDAPEVKEQPHPELKASPAQYRNGTFLVFISMQLLADDS
jgi:vacuolar protein sorting-associated protein 45